MMRRPLNRQTSIAALILVACMATGATAVAQNETRARPVVRAKRVGFKRVGGQEQAVRALDEHVVKPVLAPKLMSHLYPPKDPTRGILFTGPKGVGKTLVAKALAEELREVHGVAQDKLYYRAYDATELIGTDAKETADNIKQAFAEARSAVDGGAQRALIYVDELDGLVRNRTRDSSWDAAKVVAAFNEALDGTRGADKIMLLASTNHPENVDHALRRGGRLDLEIAFRLPNTEARQQILEIHTEQVPLGASVDLKKLAYDTPGFSGADLESLVKRSAVKANDRISQEHPELLGDNPPADKLEKLAKVDVPDIKAARKEIEPSGLRELRVEHVKVKWEDVAGVDAARAEVRALVADVRNGDKKNRFKVAPAQAGLLMGLHGGGKTLLAKAAATEMGGNFIYVRGSDIRESLYGQSARNLRLRFDMARQQAPVVLFIDEIADAIPRRGAGGPHELTETDSIIGEFLAQLDGVEKLDNVLVLAATNHPQKMDSAAIDRFDAKIHVPMQSQKGRQVLIQNWIDKRTDVIASDVSAADLAAKTERYSARSIVKLLETAARRAERAGAEKLTAAQIEKVRKETRPSVSEQELEDANRIVAAFTSTGSVPSSESDEAPATVAAQPTGNQW